MPSHLQRAIDKLMELVIALSAKVENSVRQAVQALEENNIDAAKQVVKDDVEIDKREIDIEEECLKIFALHQPVAVDLRYLVAVLKINNDLERIGDLATNIARHTLRTRKNPLLENPFDFRELYENVLSMLKGSLDAIVNLDEDSARQILVADDEVDRLHHQLSDQVLEQIKQNPDQAETLVQYLHIARHLERIADHTTNIAEDVIYLISGEIIRHGAGLEE